MSVSSRKGLASLILVIAIAGVTGCVVSGLGSQSSGGLPADKYVAIYQEYDEHGVVIGSNETLPATPIPALEPFDYDGSKGLSDQYPDEDFQLFEGIYFYYASPASGYTKAVYGGYNGQYPLSTVANLTILDIDQNGTINATCDNQTVILKAGDRWQSPVQTKVLDWTFEVDEHNVVGNMTYKPVLYSWTWTVENKGVFNKSNLRKK